LSGIVALFHLDGQPADMAVLNRLVRPISHRAVDGQKLWLDGPRGLAHLHLRSTPTSCNEVQPCGCPQELAISFDGRLDNREELINRLSESDLQNRSDAACALVAYREFGDFFAQHLKGDFAIAIFDGAQQKLLLSRDIMGIRPLYYCQTQKTFVAASEIKSILSYPGFHTQPDDDALADLLLGGDPYEKERTCFSGISRVLQGHTVVVTPEQLRSFQHWDFDSRRQIRCASIEEYAERLRFLFAQAVQRRLRSSHPVAVMVSGGLDSSAILCQAELLKAKADVASCVGISMTFPENTAADEKLYLDEIEESCGIAIQKRSFSQLRFVDNEKAIWSSEFPQLEWNARTELKRFARQSGLSC
jgi:asparagine synthase (glutamine-hydrolysing)